MKIRIEGICGSSKIGIIIDLKYILYVAYIYKDILTEKQYYVVFDPITQLQPIITTDKLSPGLYRWIS